MSRGSALGVSEIIGVGLLARIDGQLVATPDAQPRHFDFGDGLELCTVSFGDMVTGWCFTGIPNISMFVHFPAIPFPKEISHRLPRARTRNSGKLIVPEQQLKLSELTAQ